MNSTLPNSFKNSSASSKALFSKIAFLAFLVFGVANSNAQCIGPFQQFEGVRAGVPVASLSNMPGWSLSGAGNFVVGSGTGNARSGSYFLTFNAAATSTVYDAAVITPAIATPKTFSFWVRKGGTLITTYSFQASNDGGATWSAPITSATTTLFGIPVTAVVPPFPATNMTTYQQVTLDGNFPATAQGYKFKYTNTRTAGQSGAIFLDDFSWTSTNAAENTVVVPALGVPIATTATTCTVTVPVPGSTLKFYDNGGFNDFYNASAINQTMTFSPTNPAHKVSMTFNSFNTEATFDVFKVYDGTTTGGALRGTFVGNIASIPDIVSNDSGGSLTIQFIGGNAGGNAPGWDIMVESLACGTPSALTVPANRITANSARLDWTGTPGASGYDFVYYTNPATVPNFSTVAMDTYGTAMPLRKVITGLTASTTYYAYIRSDCGSGDKGKWIGPVSFTTLCEPFAVTVPTPFLEDFNVASVTETMPPCTRRDSPIWNTNSINGNLFGVGINSGFYLQPLHLVAGEEYRLTYDFSTINGKASFYVDLIQTNYTPTLADIGVRVDTQTNIQTASVNVVNLPTISATGTYYLMFYIDVLETASTQLNLDNISVEVETCKRPTAVTTSAGVPAYASRNLSWTASVSAPSNGYQYYLANSLAAAPTYSSVPAGLATGTTAVANGLAPGTLYYVWVRSDCAGKYSGWSAPASFTTATNAAVGVRISTAPTSAGTGAIPVAHTPGCNIIFYDSGGVASNYTDFESFTHTFAPATAGSKLKVEFSSFQTENGFDGLVIYNGRSTASPMINSGLPEGYDDINCPAGSFYGTNSPGTIISTATDGTLTFSFKSDYSVQRSGWVATIKCVTVPLITSFTPLDNQCVPGTTVTITGSNFTSFTTVTFGGVPAAVTSSTATQIVVVVPAGAKTGLIGVANSEAIGYSASSFNVYQPAPVTTGVEMCPGGTGVLTTAASCQGFTDAGTTLTGAWTATSPFANRPLSSFNSPACAFLASTPRQYTAVEFQVSVSGNYAFEMSGTTNDGMGYITLGTFTPGSCASGTWVIGDDDAGAGNMPRMTANLTAGLTYTLYSTTYSTTVLGSYTWTITPPGAGQIMLYATGTIQWFKDAVGGPVLGTGSSFNPVGVAGSGLPDTLSSGTFSFYAACSTNPFCRTKTDFVIKDKPTAVLDASTGFCANVVRQVTVTGDADTYVWSSVPSGKLFTDAAGTIPYNGTDNVTSLYLNTNVSTTVTVIATNTTTTCTNTVSATYATLTKTWNGTTWTPAGDPTFNDAIAFNGDYALSTDLQGCSCTVNSGDVVIKDGFTLNLVDGLHVSGGTMLFENNASLYQKNPVVNTGQITYQRSTSLRRYDYAYWSSPVAAQTLAGFSPLTLQDKYLWWDAGPSYNWASVVLPGITVMDIGKGYIIRGPQTYSIASASPWTGNFVGTPNNGTYTTPVVRTGANNRNLIGNPYPSAIDANLLLSGTGPNAGILGGTLYFWTHNTPVTALVYSPADYATYNALGSVGTAAPSPGNTTAPTGKIAAGQSFFATASLAGTRTVTFNNAMRVAASGNNNVFFRTSNQAPVGNNNGRVWLDVRNDEGGYKQMLVGYVEEATNGRDRSFDGDLFDSGSGISLYSLLDADKLTIQGRALPFDVGDTVPVGFRAGTAGTYTITLANFDGFFDSQDVFIEDKSLNVIQNLKEANYSFSTISGTFDERFVLRYTASSLGNHNPVMNENNVVVYKNNMSLFINTGSAAMNQVKIFDIRGRLLSEQKNIGMAQTVFTNLPITNEVILVQIESENGAIVTKKVVY